MCPFAQNDSTSDRALFGEHALAYAGLFHLSDAVPATHASGQIFHGPLTAALIPSFFGENQVRNYTFSDDFTLLNLEATFPGGGGLWDIRSRGRACKYEGNSWYL